MNFNAGNFYSGNSFQQTCHVSIVDTGARAALESCWSSFEGEADAVVNEPYLRHTWSPSDGSDFYLHQPHVLRRLLRAAHAGTVEDGVIMGPSYWDTSEGQLLMAESGVQCAGGGGPCPALASGWVLGATAWSQSVHIPLQPHFQSVHLCVTTHVRTITQKFPLLRRPGLDNSTRARTRTE